jgi:MFS transporter, ACS family, hexuronate transporter
VLSSKVYDVRWRILALLFFATTINYLDRILFSVLIPVIRQDIHLTDLQYGDLTGWFTLAYTIGFLVAGKFIDRFGTRIGYATAIVWWSIAAGLHALAVSAVSLAFWRAMLGFGESGNFPAAIKSVAEWFPKKDRAFATGIFNSGTNVASMLGPPAFIWLYEMWGWRAAFVAVSSTGFLWVVLWLLFYRKPPDKVEEDDPGAVQSVSWSEALRYPQTWGFVLGKFLSDPVWWFYLYWLPPYLYDVRKFNLKEIAWALPVVYTAASVGSVAGGWISGLLMRRGWEIGRARKFSMTICALCMPIAAMCVFAHGPVLTIALVSLATAAHQGWSANLYTTTSDVFPKAAVASVTGIGGFAGGAGGYIFSAKVPGIVVTHFGYKPMFLLMGSLHICALLLMSALLWRKKISQEPVLQSAFNSQRPSL